MSAETSSHISQVLEAPSRSGNFVGALKNIGQNQPDIVELSRGAVTPAPIPLDEFLAGNHLKRGDVVLTSPLGKMSASLIRWAIRSAFSHAAMLFLTRDHQYGFDENYLIETGTRGVDITALSEYYDSAKGRNLVAVKRLEAPWFNDKMRSVTSGRMLRFIKEGYDFSKAGVIGTKLNRQIFRLRNALLGRPPSVKNYASYISNSIKAEKNYLPAEFICSGFVQYAYYDVVTMLLRDQRRQRLGNLNPDEAIASEAGDEEDLRLIDDILFAPWMDGDNSIQSLLAVTPEDLAETDKLSWKYIIFRDMVYPVDSHEQAYAVIGKLI